MDASGLFTTLPMLAMSGMMMMFFITSAKPQMRYIIIGVMVLALGGTLVGQLARGGGQRKRKLKGERRDYLRYLSQLRRTVRRAAELQAQALQWNHPAPDVLWSIATTRRMWERRPSHGDFGEVRLGTGPQRLSVQLSPAPDQAGGGSRAAVYHWASPLRRQDFEQLEGGFSELATNGLNYGIHLVVTATRWSEIRPWLRDLLGTRFELHLGDPIESEIGMRLAANVPAIPGRGLTPEAAHFLAAVPRTDGIEADTGFSEAVRATAQQVAHAWTGPSAPSVRLLPSILPSGELPAVDGNIRIALGLNEEQLAPVWHDFE
jgi:DNA segregation ATPase FtsK/SpoIIIE-like protein